MRELTSKFSRVMDAQHLIILENLLVERLVHAAELSCRESHAEHSAKLKFMSKLQFWESLSNSRSAQVTDMMLDLSKYFYI